MKAIDLAVTKMAQGPSLMIDTRGGLVIFEASDIMVTDGQGGHEFISASAHGKDYEATKKAFWAEIKEQCPDCKVTFRKTFVNDSMRMNDDIPDMRNMKNYDNLKRTDIIQTQPEKKPVKKQSSKGMER